MVVVMQNTQETISLRETKINHTKSFMRMETSFALGKDGGYAPSNFCGTSTAVMGQADTTLIVDFF